jgi:hypothetical protein
VAFVFFSGKESLPVHTENPDNGNQLRSGRGEYVGYIRIPVGDFGTAFPARENTCKS